jgi:hypothetical protein
MNSGEDLNQNPQLKGKSPRKLPGRTLIRPGTGLSKADKDAILVTS